LLSVFADACAVIVAFRSAKGRALSAQTHVFFGAKGDIILEDIDNIRSEESCLKSSCW
jgi:hypothetical protein